MSIFLECIIGLAFVVTAACAIYVALELRGAMKALKEFIKNTQDALQPTLEELPGALKSMRSVTDNAARISADVKEFSGAIRNAGESIQRASTFVEQVTSSSAAHVSGIRAGLAAGLGVMLRDCLKKGK
jgi:hypothetical protein